MHARSSAAEAANVAAPCSRPKREVELGSPGCAEALGEGGAQQDASRDHRLFRHPAPDAKRHEEQDDQSQQNVEE